MNEITLLGDKKIALLSIQWNKEKDAMGRGITLEKLVRYKYCTLSAIILSSVAFAGIIILQPLNRKAYGIAALAAGLIAFLFFAKANRTLKAAQLIVENQIIHIEPAIFCDHGSNIKNEHRTCESIEVFVSCFGILLGPKIVKFNQEGVQLRAVEFGEGSISLTYGTVQKIQSIKLLWEQVSSDELTEIIRRFRYETGVTPTIMF